MDAHDILLKIIDDIQSDIDKCRYLNKKVKRHKLKKIFYNDNLYPRKYCFRTAELSYEISLRLMHLDIENKSHKLIEECVELIHECFQKCTLTTFYYIHLSDLYCLISNHKSNGKWNVQLNRN